MLVAFPFFEGDVDRMVELLEWIHDLGGCAAHDALLVADAGVEWKRCLEVKKLAARSFKTVTLISNEESVIGWIEGPKSLFLKACEYVRDHPQPFLQMETDAIPLVPCWLDKIAAAYSESAGLYMGCVYDCDQPNLPKKILSGIGIYPFHTLELAGKELEKPGVNWDIATTLAMAGNDEGQHTDLIYHLWGEKDNPPTFVETKTNFRCKQPFLLKDIPSEAVIWHRNKDGTLIDLLRKKMAIFKKKSAPVGVTGIGQFGTGQKQPPRRILTVRRTAALGDVLCATVVANKLIDLGFDVTVQAHPSAHCILRRIPGLRDVMEPSGVPQVDLDGAYENDPQRKEKHFAQMFVESANRQLAKQGIQIPNWKNFAPRMVLTDGDHNLALTRLKPYPRPWTFICPRSAAWACRTVPDQIWGMAAAKIGGTKFWLGLHAPAPAGVVDLQIRHFDSVIGLLAVADLLVTVDTGPMHVAAALGTPVVAIKQQSDPELHLSDQRDFTVIQPPNLGCLNCNVNLCPINAQTPPCQNVPPELIAAAVNARLHHVTTEDVSVVIAIYKPTAERLNKCLTAVIDQVQEIVVVVDHAGMVPRNALQNGKIRYVKCPGYDIGYGRKANYGARQTNGKYVWLLNDDCYVAGDCCQKLLEVLRSDEEIGMVGHELRYLDGTLQHGGTFRARDGVGFGHMDLHQRESRVKHPIEVENVTGASVLLRRRAFFDADGFPEHIYLYTEDNFLCMSIRQQGWKIFYTPFAKAQHEEHCSTSVTMNMHTHLLHSNQAFGEQWGWYFHKNRDNPGLGRFD